MEAATPLPFVVHLDAYSPDDVIDAAVLEAFSSRAFPVARTITLPRVRPDAPLLPPDAAPCLEASQPTFTAVLACGNGWMLRVVRQTSGSAVLTAIATSGELAGAVLAAAARDAAEPTSADTVPFAFWHRTTQCSSRTERALAIDRWADIRGNYAEATVPELDRLMATDPTRLSGRLALFYGPPGTGKTTLVRTIADAWRSWCTVEYVVDADRLFAEPEYLMDVLLVPDAEDGGADGPRWRLLVLEDCGEFLRADAKVTTGQGLSRLLNLTDGLIGQGLELLVLISTNDELKRLHPAIARPGRCFAQIRVGPLPHAQAARWLGRHDGIHIDGTTLAELYALRRDPDARAEAPIPAGMYL